MTASVTVRLIVLHGMINVRVSLRALMLRCHLPSRSSPRL